MSDYVSKYVLNPCGWFGADYVEIGAADTFGFTEFIVLEKGGVKRKYRPEHTCTMTREGKRLWFCSHCGSYYKRNSKYPYEYCPRCGAKVVEE